MAGQRGRGGYKGQNVGRRSSSRRSAKSRPKGQTSGVVQYSIKDAKGKTTYIGTTNNPRRRAAEHSSSGKLKKGDRLVVETRAVSRKSAGRVESVKLSAHRRKNGQSPKNNATRDGKFHPRQGKLL